MHWRSDDHLVQMADSDGFFGQKEKADRVAKQFFFLLQEKFLFVRAGLCSFFYGGDVDQERNEILSKVEARGLGLIGLPHPPRKTRPAEGRHRGPPRQTTRSPVLALRAPPG